MDIGPVQKVTYAQDAVSSAPRSATNAAVSSVSTDLAPGRPVAQASPDARSGNDRQPSSDGQSPVVERNLTIDPTTRQIVYQAINDRGEIVLQMPDQVMLRQRAYAKELADEAEKSSHATTIERFV